MEITITLNTDNPQDLEELRGISDKLSGAERTTKAPITTLPETETPIKEAPEPKTDAKDSKTETPKADLPPEIKATIEDVRKGLIELKEAKGSEAAKAILAEFAASKTSDLSEDKYAEVVARIVEELI